MVFYGDYEIEFEIYEKREGDWRSTLLGHMAGIDPSDAKARWLEDHGVTVDRHQKIFACAPLDEWK